MRDAVRHRATRVWLILVGATCLSWALGSRQGAIASVTVILFAIAKVRFIIFDFMELRHAPAIWRLILEGWILVVAVTLVLFYLIGT